MYNSVLIYNKRPHEIKSVTRIMKFKKIIINFLLENSLYSVENFRTIFFTEAIQLCDIISIHIYSRHTQH